MTKSMTEVFAGHLAPAVDLTLTAVGAIPGFSTAVEFLKGIDDFKSRLTVAKMRAFVGGTKSASAEDISNVEARLNTSSEREAIGEALLLAIDSFNTLYKCELLGVLYVAFLKTKLTGKQLRRLAHAIDSAFSDDLQNFLLYPIAAPWEKLPNQDFYSHLEKAGLTKINDLGVVRGGLTEPSPIEVTQLGELLREAYWAIRPVSKAVVPEHLKHIFR